METRALPGKREEEYRAGITPRIRCGTLEYSTKKAVSGGFQKSISVLQVLELHVLKSCHVLV
jgi:hypothetical protein